MRTLQIVGGRKEKIRPGDVLGALTKDLGFAASQIGKIDVNAFSTYVAVDAGDRRRRCCDRLSSRTGQGASSVKLRLLVKTEAPAKIQPGRCRAASTRCGSKPSLRRAAHHQHRRTRRARRSRSRRDRPRLRSIEHSLNAIRMRALNQLRASAQMLQVSDDSMRMSPGAASLATSSPMRVLGACPAHHELAVLTASTSSTRHGDRGARIAHPCAEPRPRPSDRRRDDHLDPPLRASPSAACTVARGGALPSRNPGVPRGVHAGKVGQVGEERSDTSGSADLLAAHACQQRVDGRQHLLRSARRCRGWCRWAPARPGRPLRCGPPYRRAASRHRTVAPSVLRPLSVIVCSDGGFAVDATAPGFLAEPAFGAGQQLADVALVARQTSSRLMATRASSAGLNTPDQRLIERREQRRHQRRQ